MGRSLSYREYSYSQMTEKRQGPTLTVRPYRIVYPYRGVDCISLSETTVCRHLLERFWRILSSPLEQLEGVTLNCDLKTLYTDFVGTLWIN